MSKPIIYLAFANDHDAHLSLLKDESQKLDTILSALHDKQAIEVYRDESTNTDDLIRGLNRFDGRLTVFHYGGHAGSKGLFLEDREAGAVGLADLLGRQKNLKLVFLNGCSTLSQVNRLLHLGVKAVIATSVPVNDDKARDFSAVFYMGMANKKTLDNAFRDAAASLKMKYNMDISQAPVECRGAFELSNSKGNTLPWGLYVNQKHREILDWKLPYKSEEITPQKETINTSTISGDGNFNIQDVSGSQFNIQVNRNKPEK